MVKFFGIFFFFFQCNAILGNIISTAVLSSGTDTYVELTDEQMGRCGSSFCSQVRYSLMKYFSQCCLFFSSLTNFHDLTICPSRPQFLTQSLTSL